jgi:hypothetical protein
MAVNYSMYDIDWYSFPNMKYYNEKPDVRLLWPMIIYYDKNFPESAVWCYKNIQNDCWARQYNQYYFKNIEDLILFKLTWGLCNDEH